MKYCNNCKLITEYFNGAMCFYCLLKIYYNKNM